MLEIDEHLHRLADDRVRSPSFDMRDEADATSIVFVCRIVETAVGVMHTVLMNQLAAEAKQHLLIPSMRPASGTVMWKTDATNANRSSVDGHVASPDRRSS